MKSTLDLQEKTWVLELILLPMMLFYLSGPQFPNWSHCLLSCYFFKSILYLTDTYLSTAQNPSVACVESKVFWVYLCLCLPLHPVLLFPLLFHSATLASFVSLTTPGSLLAFALAPLSGMLCPKVFSDWLLLTVQISVQMSPLSNDI